MTSRVSNLIVIVSLAAGMMLARPAMAQQVTYYTFDGAPGDASHGCYDPAVDPIHAISNPLLCLNDQTAAFGSGANPSFPSVTYPENLGGGTHSETLMNPAAGSQSESLWFSVPQKITNGFTSYFALRITPAQTSYATADGIAFVIQNAHGGAAADPDTACQEANNGHPTIPPYGPNSGPNVVTGGGGCIGYSGIDNSLAVEFDTYTNGWDPNAAQYEGTSGNHIAVQSCGTGVNSSSHFGPHPCLVHDDSTPSLEAINSALSIALADGNVHQVVVEYSGALGTPANQLQIFVDPNFITGTHTPVAGSVPVISVIYNIGSHLTLLGGDSAYVGFTAATGAAFEDQEILSWTFTPHTTVVQPQPLAPPGDQTTFPFGDHTYAVTYPADAPSTSGIDMVVNANTISPTDFLALISGTPFVGSQCQIYEGTGGNCIIYSTYCITHGTTNKVACPSTSDPTIAVKTAYESDNGVTPVNPGFLQGDPLFSQITSVAGDGTTATASCTGECAIVVPPSATTEHVTIAGNSLFNGTYDVTPTGVDSFTFASTVTGTGNGGYVTSNNVSNICNFPQFADPDNPGTPCWQAAKIDGTTSGKTKNFSDLVALSNTVGVVNTTTTISAPGITYPNSAQIVVSVSPSASNAAGPVTGNVSLVVDSNPALSQALVSGSATFTVPGLSGGSHSLSASYAAQNGFGASSATGTQFVTAATPSVSFTGAPATAAYQSTFNVMATSNGNTTAVIAASGACSNVGALITMTSGTGTCNLSATWAADSNYAGATAMQSTTASKLTPVITWTPAPVQLGNPLGAAQLNATANVPGTFSYTPPAGTVVNTTSQMVSALFTPAAPANYNPASASVALTVKAGPLAMVSPGSIDFGTVYLGAINTRNVTVTNIGNAAMAISGPFLSIVRGGNSNEFAAVNLCPKSLPAGKSCTITIAFVAGPYYTPQTATLNIMDNAPGNPQTVMLTATVINPQASLSTTSLSFGNQALGTTSASKAVTLRNTGATALIINSVTVTGANAGDFLSASACPSSLAAGSSCTIGVAFKPSAKTLRSATLTINDNARFSPQTVTLSGKGN